MFKLKGRFEIEGRLEANGRYTSIILAFSFPIVHKLVEKISLICMPSSCLNLSSFDSFVESLKFSFLVNI